MDFMEKLENASNAVPVIYIYMVYEALCAKSKHLCSEFQLNCKDPTVKVRIHHSRKISNSDKKSSGKTNIKVPSISKHVSN